MTPCIYSIAKAEPSRCDHLYSQAPTAEMNKEFLSAAAPRLRLLDSKIIELDLLVLSEDLSLEHFDDGADMELY